METLLWIAGGIILLLALVLFWALRFIYRLLKGLSEGVWR